MFTTPQISSSPWNRSAGRNWLIVAVAVGITGGHIGTSTMPFQIGGLIDGLGMGPKEAGTFASFEIAGLAATMVLIARWINRFSAMGIALVGVLLSVGANLVLFVLREPIPLFILAAIAGIGYGLIYAGAIAGTSQVSQPDRIFGIGTGGSMLIITLITALVPITIAWTGRMGTFVCVAAILALSAPLLIGLRNKRAASGPAHVKPPPFSSAHIALLCTWAAFSCGGGALWTFVERIGHEIGLPEKNVGFILSLGVIFGIAGTIAAAWISVRVSRGILLSAGLLISAIDCLLLSYATSMAMYFAGVALYWGIHMFVYSCLLGTAALIDPTGRLGTITGGTERLAFSGGAFLGGLVAQSSSYSEIGLIGFVAGVVGVIAGVPVIARYLARNGDHTLSAAAAGLAR